MNDPIPSGDLSAAQLFREHGAFVARFLYRLGVPAHAIDDTVQDVFLVVHQRGGYRPGPAKPTTYLALIASRAASAQRRQQRVRAARIGNAELDEIRTNDDDPAVHAERRDDLRRLQDALSRLDPALRDTLLLAEFEDETAPAIAHAMGVPVGTVYWRLHEARKKFQRALAVTDRSRKHGAAQLASGGRVSRTLSRGALSLIFGLVDRKQYTVQAEAARQAWRDSSFALDLPRALDRHVEAVRGLPAQSPLLATAGSKLTLWAGTGALKVGAWAAASACSVLAAWHLVSRAPASVPTTLQHARVPAASPPSQGTRVAQTASPSALEQPVQTAIAQRDVAIAPARANTVLPAVARAAHEPAQHGQAQRRWQPSHDHDPGRSADQASPTREAAAQTASAQPAQATHEPSALAGETLADAPRPQPQAAKPAASDARNLVLEARSLARADRLLTSAPAQSLAIVEELSRTALDAYLSEEREYIEVMALYGVGRRAEADGAAGRFLSRYRSSVFRERVKAARKSAAPGP